MTDGPDFVADTSLVECAWLQILGCGLSERKPVVSYRARHLGYDQASVRFFGEPRRGVVEVWFYKPDDPDCCGAWHVELGRVGGEVLGFLGEGRTDA